MIRVVSISGMGYFVHLFKTRIEAVLKSLTAYRKPRVVVVCMIYFLDETPGEGTAATDEVLIHCGALLCSLAGDGWADPVLALLRYNSDPAKLQALIRRVFALATSQVSLQVRQGT